MEKSEGQAGKPKGARPNREGKPWKRKDGRWCMRVYPPEGTIWTKPVYVYGKTRKDATAAHAERKAELSAGVAPAPGDKDIKIGPYLRTWLYVTLPQYVEAGEMRQSTMVSYQDNAELHIIPEAKRGVPTLAHIDLLELSAPAVREWRSGLLAKPAGRQRKTLRPGESELPPPALLGRRTVNYCRAILHKALADAIRDEVAGLQRNVVDLVPPLTGSEGAGKAGQARTVAKRAISPGHAAALLIAMAEDPLWCYWLVGFAQGFRRGEGLGMRWADLDFDARTWKPALSVQRQRGPRDPETGKRKGRLVAGELKTDASAETAALTKTAAEALGRWKPEQNRVQLAAARWADLGLVFTTAHGTALEPRNVNRAWARLCEKAGVPAGIRLHDLRHACASYALANGADLKSVQRLLRHARLDTTQLYLHAVDEVPRAGADAIDTAIDGLRALASAPERE
jgi:integrase